MNIMRWGAFDERKALRLSMHRLFDDVFAARRPRGGIDALDWEPAVEMFETEQAVVVRAELPNIDPQQVEITVTNDTITLKGQTAHDEERKSRNYYRSE